MSIGLDVHAGSVAGCGLDGETGEGRMGPQPEQIADWIASSPGRHRRLRGGPTGYGLYRTHDIIRCQVAALSNLQRPLGDRAKNDNKDAFQLARLVRVGDIVEVTVLTVEQGARAGSDPGMARGPADLQRARHGFRSCCCGTA